MKVREAGEKRRAAWVALQFRCAAEELQDLVIAYGGDPETSSHLSGTLHRRWVDVRSAITGKSNQDVLDECERGGLVLAEIPAG